MPPRKQEFPPDPRAKLDEIVEREVERVRQEGIAWRRRPRLPTAIFADTLRDEEVIAQGCAISRSDDPAQETEKVAKKLGWSDYRLDIFTQVAAAYNRNPTIENYVRVRRGFPEVEIEPPSLRGSEAQLYLERDFQKQGIDPQFIGGALGGDDAGIDALCLNLLECLIARGNLPKEGPGHIQKRRDAISDATVNYLISEMLVALREHEETFRVPASLVVLIRHQLCALKPELYEEILSRKRRQTAALAAAQKQKQGERISVNRLAAMAGVPRSTAARWLADKEFQQWLEAGRRCAEDLLEMRGYRFGFVELEPGSFAPVRFGPKIMIFRPENRVDRPSAPAPR